MALKIYPSDALTDLDITALKDGKTFKLSTYSNPQNSLKLDKSDVFPGRFSVVDTKRLLVVAIVIEFLKVGLICTTPYPTDYITFSIAAVSIALD
jgi:hypothetical protein